MWFRILVLALGTFALGTDSFVIAGILPDLAGSLHISLALAGLNVTIFALVYALGAPVLGALAGSLERRRLLLLSLTLLTLANLLAAFATTLPFLMAVRVLAAIGASMYTPTASAVATALAPEKARGRALALVMTGLTASTVLGIPLGVLIATWLNWRATMIFVALLSALAFAGVLLLFPRVAAPPVVPLRARLAFLKQPGLLLVLLQTALFLAGYQIIGTYNRPLLEQITHLDGVMLSVMLAIFGLAGMLGGILGGYATDRWGNLRTLMACLIIVSITLFLLPWTATTFLGAALTFVAWGIAGWGLLPAQQHRLVAFSPAAAGIILSLNSSAIYFGISGGSALGSVLFQSTSLSVMCWVAAVWESIPLVLVLLSVRAKRRREKQEGEEKAQLLSAKAASV
jgi:DHA1 family inner membrane transport protein